MNSELKQFDMHKNNVYLNIVTLIKIERADFNWKKLIVPYLLKNCTTPQFYIYTFITNPLKKFNRIFEVSMYI